MLTCDAVVAEACSFIPTPVPVLTLLACDDLILDFDFAGQITGVQALATKCADRPMDLADACLVPMTELNPDCPVWTVERTVFRCVPKAPDASRALRFPSRVVNGQS